MVELPGREHLPWLGDMDELLEPLEEFFTGSRPERQVERALGQAFDL